MTVRVYRKVKQTKFVRDGWAGLVALTDSGAIAGSADHKVLFNGLDYEVSQSYRVIRNPTAAERGKILDALFA
ncbi:MAG: hypothetical protein ACK2UO_13680 [Caldilineaceae bacterium]